MVTSRTSILGIALVGLLAACDGSPAAPAAQQAAGEPAVEAEKPAAQAKVSQARGRFESSGLMTDARQTAVAVRLGDGRVFVAGGRGKGRGANARAPRFNTATIWDPSTREWADIADMDKPREEATAHLLQDGRVIVLGGRDIIKYQRSTEIYDPAAESWVTGPRMKKKRFDHASARLDDGTVLVMGGADDFLSPFDSAEICDPAADQCTPAGTTSHSRMQHAATLLQDGRVLVSGGTDVGGIGVDVVPLASAEIYDPAIGEWSEAPNMSVGHTRHTATLLGDGRVLVTGGAGKVAEAEIFDPATNIWEPAGTMSRWRAHHTATGLSDGRALITGGIGNVESTEFFDPATGAWAIGPTMDEARYDHSATLLADGRVLVVAGQTTDANLERELSNTSEVWSP